MALTTLARARRSGRLSEGTGATVRPRPAQQVQAPALCCSSQPPQARAATSIGSAWRLCYPRTRVWQVVRVCQSRVSLRPPHIDRVGPLNRSQTALTMRQRQVTGGTAPSFTREQTCNDQIAELRNKPILPQPYIQPHYETNPFSGTAPSPQARARTGSPRSVRRLV